MVTANGKSPLTVRGLDPGTTYSVTISVFNDNEVGLQHQTLTQTITVNSGNISVYYTIAIYIMHRLYTYTYYTCWIGT